MPLTQQDIETLKSAILPELKRELRETVEQQLSADRRWIKGILAASRASKIHKDELRTLLRDGKIRGYQREDCTWIIDRHSLDAWHEKNIESRLATDDYLKNKIVDFIKQNS